MKSRTNRWQNAQTNKHVIQEYIANIGTLLVQLLLILFGG